MEQKRQLARIKSAGLNIKDRGVLTFFVDVEYEDGFHQCTGNLILDTYDDEKKRRVGTAYGCEMIRRLLLLLDVNNLEEVAGKIIYVYGEGSSSVLDFTPTGYGTLPWDGGKDLFFDDVVDEFFDGVNND